MARLDDAASKAKEAVGDVTSKAREFLDDSRVKDALKSDKVEEVSDSILGAVTKAAKKVTGGRFDDKIDEVREAADKKIGN